MKRRNTKQRQIVLDVINSRCDHPTAEQIYSDVKKIDPNISLGTVYRNLAILAEDKKILDIRLSGSDKFDLRTDEHSHFLCDKCGRVYDADIEYDEKIDRVESKSGFYVTSHQIIYNGICAECLKKQQTDNN